MPLWAGADYESTCTRAYAKWLVVAVKRDGEDLR
jgi:hypothetical protein